MKGQLFALRFLLVLELFCFVACRSKIKPESADREVRELLKDVPGFNWELSNKSRLNPQQSSPFPLAPRDDPESRKITELVQEKSAYPDGNSTDLLVGIQWKDSLPIDEDGVVSLNL